MTVEETTFFVLAAASVAGAVVLVFGARTTVGAALGAVGSSLAVGGLFALLSAPFLFVTQLLLVAGAALLGLLFVVLLVDLEAVGLPARSARRRVVNGLGVIAASVLTGLLAITLESTPRTSAEVDAGLGGAFAIGRTLYGEFAPPLVALSLIMLSALVAARVLAPDDASVTSPKKADG